MCSGGNALRPVVYAMMQVVSVQYAGAAAASNGVSGVAATAATAAAVSGVDSHLSSLQMALARRLSQDPGVLNAPQQQKWPDGLGPGKQLAGHSCSSGNGAAHVVLRLGGGASAAGTGVGSQQLHGRGGAPDQQQQQQQHPVNMDVGSSCGSGVQAAATSLRRSMERQASIGSAAMNGERLHSFELGKPPAAARRSSHSNSSTSLGKRRSNSMDKQLPGFGSGFSTIGGQSGAAGVATALLQPDVQLRSSSASMIQPQVAAEEAAARQLRLMEMCDNHAMFQFLFDTQGKLLCANSRAMNNMRGG